jgi:hypothetical protein
MKRSKVAVTLVLGEMFAMGGAADVVNAHIQASACNPNLACCAF